MHALASLSFLGCGLFGVLALAADGSGTFKDRLVALNFPLYNRRVADGAAALQAAPASDDVADFEVWKSTTIAKLRTLTTEEGWAAVAKDARLAEGSSSGT